MDEEAPYALQQQRDPRIDALATQRTTQAEPRPQHEHHPSKLQGSDGIAFEGNTRNVSPKQRITPTATTMATPPPTAVFSAGPKRDIASDEAITQPAETSTLSTAWSSETRSSTVASIDPGSKTPSLTVSTQSTSLPPTTVALDAGCCESQQTQTDSFAGTQESWPASVGQIAADLLPSAIALSHGAEILCHLSVMYLLKDTFRLTPSSISVVMTTIRLPWILKLLWAVLSDCVPLFGQRRESYIAVGATLCILAYLGLGCLTWMNLTLACGLLFAYFVGASICSVVGEALVVEKGRGTEVDYTTKTVSQFFGIRKLSVAVMSYLSGFLLSYISERAVFCVATVLPLMILILALLSCLQHSSFTPETFDRSQYLILSPGRHASQGTRTFSATQPPNHPLPRRQGIYQHLCRTWRVLKEPHFCSSILFIFALMATPSSGAAMFYFMTNQLQFSSEILGRLALFQSLASLLGILFYVTFLRQASIRSILFWSTVLVTPFCFLPCFMVARWNVAIGLSDVAFLLTDTVLMEFVGEFQCLPLLILAAQLCPVGLESTLYAILLSANHLGLTVSALVSAGLIGLLGITATNFFHLGFLVALCAASNLLPLLLLPLVPKTCSASAFIARVELPDEHTGSQQPVASEETPLCVKPSDYSPDYADPFYATSSSICQNGFTSHRPMHCPESTNNDITNAQVLRFQQEGIKTPSSCTTITEDQEKGEEQGSSPRMAILRDTVIHDNMIMAAHILNIQ